MNVLALDLGTKTGWAFGNAKAYLSGTWNLRGGRYEGGGMRYLRFKGFVEEVHKNARIDRIVYEEVRRHAGTDAAHVYGGLMGALTAWAEENGVPYEAVPVGTIKKFWTGKGNASKDAMIEECRNRGIEVKDDNEADAVALLHQATEKVNGAGAPMEALG